LQHTLVPTLFPYTTLFRSAVTIVHTIHHTNDVSWWQRVLPVLGFGATDRPGTWAGSGLLTIRQAGAADQDGATELEVLVPDPARSEEHTSELQSRFDLVCR